MSTVKHAHGEEIFVDLRMQQGVIVAIERQLAGKLCLLRAHVVKVDGVVKVNNMCRTEREDRGICEKGY